MKMPFYFLLGLYLASFVEAQEEVYKLEQLNINDAQVTVSGFSAGASMATQMHVAHSSLFSGLAMFSQVFYRCGPNSLIEFSLRCSHIGQGIVPGDVRTSIADAHFYARTGLIDDLENLKSHRVFIWVGNLDEYVPPDLVSKNAEFYSAFIPNETQISLTMVPQAAHVFPTDDFGDSCEKDASENYYLGNCNYSGAYHSLKFLLGDQIMPTNGNINLSTLRLFNQSEFHPGSDINVSAMGTQGFIYIPEKCLNKELKCLLHFNFHGCHEWPTEVAENYIRNSGFLPVAETNNIIMVFPLTTKVPQNMNGCWDFFSYTGRQFATREGAQVKIIHRMIERLLHGPDSFTIASYIHI